MKRFFLVTAILWTFVILAICWIPARSLANDDGSESWLFRLLYLDKVIHFGLFLGFSFLWSLTASNPRRSAWMILLAGIVLAITTEFVQKLPGINRQADFDDGIADIVGVICGLLVITLWSSMITRRGTENSPATSVS